MLNQKRKRFFGVKRHHSLEVYNQNIDDDINIPSEDKEKKKKKKKRSEKNKQRMK